MKALYNYLCIIGISLVTQLSNAQVISYFNNTCGSFITSSEFCGGSIPDQIPISVSGIGNMNATDNLGLVGLFLDMNNTSGINFDANFTLSSPGGSVVNISGPSPFPNYASGVSYVTFVNSNWLPVPAGISSSNPMTDVAPFDRYLFGAINDGTESGDGTWILESCHNTGGAIDVLCMRLDFGRICPEIVSYTITNATCSNASDGSITIDQFLDSEICGSSLGCATEFILDGGPRTTNTTFSGLSVGIHTIELYYEAMFLNTPCSSQTISFEILSDDTQAPSLTSCENPSQTFSVDANCIQTVSLSDPVVSDNCTIANSYILITFPDGTTESYSPISSGNAFDYDLDLGDTHFYWYAEDDNGNFSTCETTVTLIDDMAPSWTQSNISTTGECGIDDINILREAAESLFTFSDNCDPAVNLNLISTTPTLTNVCGASNTYTYEYEISDQSGNFNTITGFLDVIMEDNTVPSITGLPNDVTINCTDAFPPIPEIGVDVFANDACAGDITSSIVHQEVIIAQDCTLPGNVLEIIECTFTVDDGCGNTAEEIFEITVTDNQGPVFEAPFDQPIVITGECGVDDLMFLINDNFPTATGCSGAATVNVTNTVFTPQCNNSSGGTYEVEFTAIDACNNTTTIIVDFDLLDTQGPILVGIVNDETIFCDDPFPAMPTITAMDNCEGDLTANINITGSSSPGSSCALGAASEIFTYTWAVEDACGNTNNYVWEVVVINDYEIDLGPDIEACIGEVVNVMGDDPNATYLWSTGETTQSIDVMVAGTYFVTATSANNCCSEDQISVNFNSLPTAMATGATLDCQNPTATINGNSSDPNATYNWTGPNGFMSSDQNPTVNIAGDYLLTVTNLLGCIDTAIAVVTQDAELPNLEVIAGTIDCNNPTVTLMATSTTSGVSFDWTGPNNYTSNQPNSTVSTGGTYTATATSQNGCSVSMNIEVIEDTVSPLISVSSGEITCTNLQTMISASSSDGALSYSWTGPNNYSSADANNTVSIAGEYIVVATALNGCTTKDTVEVTEDLEVPNLSTNENQTIDCSNSNVLIEASSSTTGVNYSWTGPSNYNSAMAFDSVSVAGVYIVEITAPNGCTARDSVEVIQNSTLPDLTMNTPSIITCNQMTSEISGSTSVNGVSYVWTGPNGYSSTAMTNQVSVSGVYTLLVTSSNGCSAEGTVTVEEDLEVPEVVVSGNTLDCESTSVEISATSNTSGVSYAWTGPGNFSSNEPNPTVNQIGMYQVIVTAENGCSSSAMAEVVPDADAPSLTLAGEDINCINNEATLVANSTTPGVTYAWTGPNNYSSSNESITVELAGEYIIVVTALNGCTSQSSYTVKEDTEDPIFTVLAGELNCIDTITQIVVNSDETLMYNWTGPNGFNSDVSSPVVTEAGDYLLLVTGENGCTAELTVGVTENIEFPIYDLSQSFEQDCEDFEYGIQILHDGNISFVWSGPNGFNSVEESVLLTQRGEYSLLVSGSNGCTIMETFDIDPEVEQVALIIDPSIDSLELNCNIDEIEMPIMLASNGSNVLWTGPNDFMSTIINPIINTAGEYLLTVSSSTNCIEEILVNIVSNTEAPMLEISGDSMITCDNNTAFIIGISSEAISYLWEGPSGFSSTESAINVGIEGEYRLTVAGQNGCEKTETFLVTADNDLPRITIETDNVFPCGVTEMALIANSENPDDVFSWVGPNGFTSNEQTPFVTDLGVYILTVTSPSGCDATQSVEVTAPPIIEADISSTPAGSANDGTASIIITNGEGPFMIVWDNGEEGTTVENLSSGEHTVEVTDKYGCVMVFEFVVDINTAVMDLDLIGNGMIFPTIANSFINVTYDFNDRYDIQLSIVDLNGRMIKQDMQKSISKIDTRYDLSEMKSGTYLMIISTGEFVKAEKFIIVK